MGYTEFEFPLFDQIGLSYLIHSILLQLLNGPIKELLMMAATLTSSLGADELAHLNEVLLILATLV